MSHKTNAKAQSAKKPVRETGAAALRQALVRRLPQRLTASCQLTLPPVPGLLDHYVKLCNDHWQAIGRPVSDHDLEVFRDALKTQLEKAWVASPFSRVLVRYDADVPPNASLNWQIETTVTSLTDEYDRWLKTRTPPLFGKHPDAKLMDIVRSLGEPSEVGVLDVGAGTGRNTLPLARAGFRTDAVELVPGFVMQLREQAAREALPIEVFEGSLFDPSLSLPSDRYRALVLAEVVSHFRSVPELRALFEIAARLLPAGGLLVFSAFLASDGYKPDDAARQMSQVMLCNLFLRRELGDAAEGLPFQLLSDESVRGYEEAHLAPELWPPTGWFEGWTGGQDVFDLPPGKPPFEMRWLVYRKTATA